MMPTIGRLKKRPDFLKVAARGSKWVTPGLILQARKRTRPGRVPDGGRGGQEDRDADLVRVGFTVSRKVGKAVERNRARRRLRAAAQSVLADLGRPGYDYVLIGRGATLERPYAQLVKDLRTALRRVGEAGDSVRKAGAPGRGTERKP